MYDVVQQTSALDNLIMRAQQLRDVIKEFKDTYLVNPITTQAESKEKVIDDIISNIQFDAPNKEVHETSVSQEMANIDLDSIIAGIDFGNKKTI